jgi:hypothetical protein
MLLRRIFGPKRDEVTGGWRKLHNEELRDLLSSPSISRMFKSRKMKWTENVARVGKRESLVIIGGKFRRKETVGKPSRRWVDNI